MGIISTSSVFFLLSMCILDCICYQLKSVNTVYSYLYFWKLLIVFIYTNFIGFKTFIFDITNKSFYKTVDFEFLKHIFFEIPGKMEAIRQLGTT